MADRAANRHALALLALLATSRGSLMARDKVIATLWPEGDTDSVRHRLNVVLYELRRTLGRQAITSVNDALRLDTEAVWIDVAQFTAALHRGASDEADSLYRGPFLDGFHLPEAPEFEEWCSRERLRLGLELRHAMERQAALAESNGDHDTAVRCWRRLVELESLGTRATMGLMRALGARGDLREAEQVAAAFQERERSESGGSSNPVIETLLAALRRSQPVVTLPDTVSRAELIVPPESAPPAMGPIPKRVTLRRWPGVVAAASVVTIALTALWLPKRDGGRAAARSVQGDIVIMPFTVHGADRLAYLSDGMAELLSITLDGAGMLRSADPHSVLAFVRRGEEGPMTPQLGSRAARHFGATHFVLGSVIGTPGRMDLRATLYDAGGSVRAVATGAAADDGDLAPVVDTLTRQLIASLIPSGVERLTRLAVSTSASLPALRAYIEGEARVRAGDHNGAVEAYRRATVGDSTFALAWYRLAVSLENTLQPNLARDAAAQAVRHSHRLPERDRLLLEGWSAYAAGRADAADGAYRRILDLYPNELEAWLQVGEIAFHHAASRGRTIAVARDAFARVLTLDPDHEAAHVHLARIAGQSRDTAALIRHTQYLIAKRAGSAVTLEMAAFKAFVTGDNVAVDTLRPRFAREDSYTLVAMLMNAFHAGDLQGMDWCAGLLQAATRPVEVRTAGHVVDALLHAARGDRDAALRAVSRAELLDSVRGVETRALILTMPVFPPDSVEAGNVRARLMRLSNQLVPESFFLPDPDFVRPLLHQCLIGLLDAQTGNHGAAFRTADMLELLRSPASDSTLAHDLAAGVRAEVARVRHDTSGAVKILSRIIERPAYQLVLPSPFEARARERYLRALLVERSGRGPDQPALGESTARSLYDLVYDRARQQRYWTPSDAPLRDKNRSH